MVVGHLQDVIVIRKFSGDFLKRQPHLNFKLFYRSNFFNIHTKPKNTPEFLYQGQTFNTEKYLSLSFFIILFKFEIIKYTAFQNKVANNVCQEIC